MKVLCPLTFHELQACDVVENAVRVGEETILFLPSFQSCPKLEQVSNPIEFNVIERTKLISLSEGKSQTDLPFHCFSNFHFAKTFLGYGSMSVNALNLTILFLMQLWILYSMPSELILFFSTHCYRSDFLLMTLILVTVSRFGDRGFLCCYSNLYWNGRCFWWLW